MRQSRHITPPRSKLNVGDDGGMNKPRCIWFSDSLVERSARAVDAPTSCVVAASNNALEPTLATKARFVWFSSSAAQRKRSMWKEELEREYRCLVADEEVTVVPVLSLGSRRRAAVNSASGMIEEETMNKSCAIHPSGSLVILSAEASAAASSCVVAASNNALEPTPVTKARFVWLSSGAAQRKR